MGTFVYGTINSTATNMPIAPLSGLSGEASVNNGSSYSSTGVTTTDTGGGSFSVELTDALMQSAPTILVRVTATNPGSSTWEQGLDGWNSPVYDRLAVNKADALEGGRCSITNVYYPASKLQTLENGIRVADWLKIDGDRW